MNFAINFVHDCHVHVPVTDKFLAGYLIKAVGGYDIVFYS